MTTEATDREHEQRAANEKLCEDLSQRLENEYTTEDKTLRYVELGYNEMAACQYYIWIGEGYDERDEEGDRTGEFIHTADAYIWHDGQYDHSDVMVHSDDLIIYTEKEWEGPYPPHLIGESNAGVRVSMKEEGWYEKLKLALDNALGTKISNHQVSLGVPGERVLALGGK